ncbi:MAG TPA: spore coat protein CotJB [Halanaerobiales bacterium]|nr:spore coat protein CotJB [Halanaerobiales bacterium]
MATNRPRVNTELLQRIQQLNFAVLETVLYLNTHPRCREVLRLHNELSREYHEAIDEYQRRYGPLYADYADADYPWQWKDSPWPWEITY